MAPLGYWTDFEASIAVICACVPDSRFFLSRLIPSWKGTADKNSIRKNNSPYQLTDLSARSARIRAIQMQAGMISVTTDFDLKSTVNLGSREHLTHGAMHVPWERPDTLGQEEAGAGAERSWPLRAPPRVKS